jgi:hypothetical protein
MIVALARTRDGDQGDDVQVAQHECASIAVQNLVPSALRLWVRASGLARPPRTLSCIIFFRGGTLHAWQWSDRGAVFCRQSSFSPDCV